MISSFGHFELTRDLSLKETSSVRRALPKVTRLKWELWMAPASGADITIRAQNCQNGLRFYLCRLHTRATTSMIRHNPPTSHPYLHREHRKRNHNWFYGESQSQKRHSAFSS
ncbi:hypothetical protein BC938DRAFT_482545 [Jimgerdemannia flammicorona]|uniref:Uncharacterized protein n=1 Tax=Jimgerdemannia flammicorona TaxID=994334 RepID=A0A433QDS7_9FUNG|nr:hypothetical protein BC938DRAFT_482545 [Jimgerdemannia flammicorona]